MSNQPVHGMAHAGSGSTLLAAVHQVNGEIERSRPAPQPFTEEWYAEVDRQCQRRKDTDAQRLEREHAGLGEQQQARDNIGKLWP